MSLLLQVEVLHRGEEALKADVERLKAENDNLKSFVATISADPDKGGRRCLELYEQSLDRALERAEAAFAECGQAVKRRVLPRDFLLVRTSLLPARAR